MKIVIVLSLLSFGCAARGHLSVDSGQSYASVYGKQRSAKPGRLPAMLSSEEAQTIASNYLATFRQRGGAKIRAAKGASPAAFGQGTGNRSISLEAK